MPLSFRAAFRDAVFLRPPLLSHGRRCARLAQQTPDTEVDIPENATARCDIYRAILSWGTRSGFAGFLLLSLNDARNDLQLPREQRNENQCRDKSLISLFSSAPFKLRVYFLQTLNEQEMREA